MKRQWALILLAAILFAFSAETGNAAQKRSRSTTASRKARAPELGSVAQFKDAFQDGAGKLRLVALVSPT
jgi:hypothetical protein